MRLLLRLLLIALCVFVAPATARAQQQVAAQPLVPVISRELLKVELGKKLFFDPRMSADNSTSCATCHDPDKGWSDGLPVAVGMAQKIPGPRRTPPATNVAFQELQFWDQRANSLADQSLQPLTNPIEMGNPSRQFVVQKLGQLAGYQQLSVQAFGRPLDQAVMSEAIVAYERTLLGVNAPIDRYLAGDKTALSERAIAGLAIFNGAQCVACHQPPMYRDGKCHNTGIEFAAPSNDNGRAKVDPRATPRSFKTPTLRDVEKRAPYTHAGRAANLRAMVDHYARGGARPNGQRDPQMDPLVRPLLVIDQTTKLARPLNEEERNNLVEFLQTAFASKTYPKRPNVELP